LSTTQYLQDSIILAWKIKH